MSGPGDFRVLSSGSDHAVIELPRPLKYDAVKNKMRKAWELSEFEVKYLEWRPEFPSDAEAPASPTVSVASTAVSVVHSSANLGLIMLRLEL